MRILYVDGVLMFARANLCLLNEKHFDPDWTVVHVGTCVEAVEKLENEAFDLVISSLLYPGNPDPAGKALSRAGGVDLFRFVAEKNAAVGADEKIAFCFLTRPESHEVRAVLEKHGLEVIEDLRIYRKGTPLHAIIEDFKKGRLNAPAPTRPAHRKTAEGKNPSAVKKEPNP